MFSICAIGCRDPSGKHSILTVHYCTFKMYFIICSKSNLKSKDHTVPSYDFYPSGFMHILKSARVPQFQNSPLSVLPWRIPNRPKVLKGATDEVKLIGEP